MNGIVVRRELRRESPGPNGRRARLEARDEQHRVGRALLEECRNLLRTGPSDPPPLPTDALGSVAHAESMVVAAAAHPDVVAALGVDVERAVPLAPAVRAALLHAHEQRRAASIHSGCGDTIVFTAKEAAFKALDLDADQMAQLSVRPGPFERTLRIDVPPSEQSNPHELRGTWSIHDGHIVTVVHAPSRP